MRPETGHAGSGEGLQAARVPACGVARSCVRPRTGHAGKSARYWPYFLQLEPPLPRPDLLRRIFDEAADVLRPPALPPVPAVPCEAALPEWREPRGPAGACSRCIHRACSRRSRTTSVSRFRET